MAFPLLLALGGGSACASSYDDQVGAADKADEVGPWMLGSFRAAAGDTTTKAFSALVLRSDFTYYAEFCHGAVGSPECQRGHLPGHTPRLDSQYDHSGGVAMERGQFRRGTHDDGQPVLYFAAPGAFDERRPDQWLPDIVDRWAYHFDGESLLLWRDSDFLNQPRPEHTLVENDVRLVPAPPICWLDADCHHQGVGPGPFACSFVEPVGPGECRPR